MTIALGLAGDQRHRLTLDMADVEVFGGLVNLSLPGRRNTLFFEISVAVGVVFFRGVDADQADLAVGLDVKGVAIVDPVDCALQDRIVLLSMGGPDQEGCQEEQSPIPGDHPRPQRIRQNTPVQNPQIRL